MLNALHSSTPERHAPRSVESELQSITQTIFNDPVIALHRCRHILGTLDHEKDALLFARAAALLALIQDQLGEQVGAKAALLEALTCCRQQGLGAQEVIILERLGRELYTTGDFIAALRHWVCTLELGAAEGINVPTRTLALIGLGQCCSALGDISLATRFHRAAVSLVETLDDPYLIAKAKISLGWDLRECGDPQAAQQLLSEALNVCITRNFQFFQAELRLRLAEAELELGHIDEAEYQAEEGLAQLVFAPSHWCEANLLALLANLNARQGATALALELVQRGLQIVSLDRMQHVEARLCAQAADYCQQLGQASSESLFRERLQQLQLQKERQWETKPEQLAELLRQLPDGF